MTAVMETTEAVYQRAIEVEAADGLPDDVCPECRQDITGWEAWSAHFRPDYELSVSGAGGRQRAGIPWPFVHDNQGASLCVFDRDMLAARAFRRRYIAAHEATMAVAS